MNINVSSVSPGPGCSGGVDHSAEVHGRSARAQVPHGHQRRQREDPRDDQNLRVAGEEDVQERAAGAAGGGGGEWEGMYTVSSSATLWFHLFHV